MTIPGKSQAPRTGLPGRTSDFLSERHQHRSVPSHFRVPAKKPLSIMKFGGTSVGDAACIGRVVEIVRAASKDSDVIVVVSAMSGVTNQLIAAAGRAQAGDCQEMTSTFVDLRRLHHAAATSLIQSEAERSRIAEKINELFEEGERFCQGIALLHELTPRTRDAISSLGERLSVPLVAAALAECGVASAAVEATELVVTDGCHGNAEPKMDLTRQRCEARLRPLLQRGIIPVVTGFIGATADGVLTTLGRGGSDYSATIVGAALGADQVIIWTDVDGLQTADPRLVPAVLTLVEVSYGEAAELAYFGAKVLHPKTLRPVMQCGIPLWVRNTFAPERAGTKITPRGPQDAEANTGAVTALTAISDVCLLTLGGPALAGVQDVLGRVSRTTASVRAEVLLISQASAQNGLCLVIPSANAKDLVHALRHEFAREFAREPGESIVVDENVAVITVVGRKMTSSPGTAGRIFATLGRENINIVAMVQGSSECGLTFVVARTNMKTALVTLHREFQLAGILSGRADTDEDRNVGCRNYAWSDFPLPSDHNAEPARAAGIQEGADASRCPS
jgi:aspartate kinase